MQYIELQESIDVWLAVKNQEMVSGVCIFLSAP